MAKRHAAYPILDLIRDRWSPRAMSGELITRNELYTLFEAARWAPSSYNNQPWSFVFAERDSREWPTFVNLLDPANQRWADKAAVLVVVVSRTLFFYNNKFSRTHSFDTGAATENLALQGYSMGLVIHGMQGFDYGKTQAVLQIPKEYEVEAMFAIGKPGSSSSLPEELQEREKKRSDRKPLEGFVFEGLFGKKI